MTIGILYRYWLVCQIVSSHLRSVREGVEGGEHPADGEVPCENVAEKIVEKSHTYYGKY